MKSAAAGSVRSPLWQHLPVLYKIAQRTLTGGRPYVFSFNIADRCPIGCNCYWRAQARVPELSDEKVVEFFQWKRDDGFVLANIVGGEPYVRPKLLEEVAGILPFNWLVTSGPRHCGGSGEPRTPFPSTGRVPRPTTGCGGAAGSTRES